ncbi:MAG: FAD-dependent oxidoreductase [Candidatus Heimdallarchaeota archaeon]|nr:MAG: FAD-dependent oxidoreductase [Candidatus Heimdallarchaeota archaeon]
MNSVDKKPHVVILGGGTGGVIVANLLGRKAKKLADVTLVSKQENVFYEPDLIYRIFDKKSTKKQYRPLRKVVNKRVKILNEEVIHLDPKGQKVQFKSGNDISYDYLVIATGAHYNYDNVPGYAGEAHHFYDEEAALKLRDALESFEGGNIVTGVADLPYKCPIAPIEVTFMLYHYFKRRKMLEQVNLHYLSPLGGAFSIEQASEKFEKQFEKKGIELHEFFNTEEILPEKKVVSSLEGEEINYDLLILVPPHEGATYIDDRELANEQGWVLVDTERLQSLAYPNIFAVGDTTELPISKAGSTAHYQAKVASKNILRLIKEGQLNAKYNGHAQCFVMMGLTSAMVLDFTYTRPPLRIGYIPNRLFYYVKKFFARFFFRGVLSGRI